MKISHAGISSVTHVTDDLALANKFSRRQAVGISLEMSVIENEFLVGAELIDRYAAALAREESDDLAVGGSHDRRAGRGRNIDRVVDASFRTRVGESVQQLIGSDANYRNDQFQSSDKTFGERRSFRGLTVTSWRRDDAS